MTCLQGYRSDIGIDNDFNVKMTPIDESPAFSQNLPIPFPLKQDIKVKVALFR